MHQSLEEKKKLYWELKTGAESGWDYSSRWFSNKNTTKKDTIESLKDIKPRSIIPVDLNSILATNARIISMYYQDYLKDKERSLKYKSIADNLKDSIENVLWNEEEGIWLDYDLNERHHKMQFSLSDLLSDVITSELSATPGKRRDSLT